MRLTVCVLLLTLVVARPASAQLCSGNPSFQSGPYQVGVAASFTEGARGVEGTIAAGGDTLFAGAGVSVVKFTDVNVRAAGITGFVGGEFATDTRNKALLCPIVSVAFVAGPDVGPADVSSAGVQAGARIGFIASEDRDTMIVPFFGLAALYQHVSTTIAGAEFSASDTGGIADLGVGFILNKNVGVTPMLSIPFSAGSSDVIFTLRFSFNFGR